MTSSRKPIIVSAAFIAMIMVQLIGLRAAQANCAIWTYRTEFDPETGHLVVCGDDRDCSAGDVLIREDLETGEVFEISGNCGEGYDASCFVDECVPAGSFRYGTEEPLACGCGVSEIFTNVEIVDALEGCEPSNAAELVLREEGAPWGNQATIDCPGGCAAASNPTHVGVPALMLLGLLGLTLALRRRWER